MNWSRICWHRDCARRAWWWIDTEHLHFPACGHHAATFITKGVGRVTPIEAVVPNRQQGAA